MKELSDTGNVLLIAAFAIQLLSIVFLSFKNERKALFTSNITMLVGLTLGLISTLSSTLFSSAEITSVSIFSGLIRLDGLSLYFLFVIQLVAIPTTIYSISYLRHYVEQKRSVKSFITFYIILLISTQFIVIANQAILFLVSWEVMSISAYFAIVYEKESEEVQTGSFYYFAASHVLIFILYIIFFLFHHETGSWFFSDYHLSFSSGLMVPVIFILSIIGFGIKAGFMPFHFWLPQSHPIAPTVLSAFLSGIIMTVRPIVPVFIPLLLIVHLIDHHSQDRLADLIKFFFK